MNRTEEAKAYHQSCKDKLDTNHEPRQKFQIGDIVHITKNMPSSMFHFKCDVEAIVQYTYHQMYGCDNFTSYSLIINGHSHAWYDEDQLTLVTKKDIS